MAPPITRKPSVHLPEEVELQPLVLLLARQHLRVGGDVGDHAGLADLEDGGRGGELAPVDLQAGLVLRRLVGREDLSGVG